MRSKGAISEPKIPGSSELTITYRSTDSLKLDEQNLARHSNKQIRKIASSIEGVGFVVPVIIN